MLLSTDSSDFNVADAGRSLPAITRISELDILIEGDTLNISFFVDDNTVRTLSLYEHTYRDGQQPILIDEMRDPLSRSPSEQTVTLCTDGSDVIEELFEASPPFIKGRN